MVCVYTYYRYKLLEDAEEQVAVDGLNSLKYKLISMEKRRLYTWIYVRVNMSDYI